MKNILDKIKTWFKMNWRRAGRRVLILGYTGIAVAVCENFGDVVMAWIVWLFVEFVLGQIKKNSAAKPI